MSRVRECDSDLIAKPILAFVGSVIAVAVAVAALSPPPKYDPNQANAALAACFEGASKLQNQTELDYREIIRECTTYARQVAAERKE